MKSTTNLEFNKGNKIEEFDFVVLLAEDNVEAEEYEKQRAFLEYYFQAPIAAAFTTYAPLRLPEDLASKLKNTKVIEEDMTGKEMEVLQILNQFVDELGGLQSEHDNLRLKPAYEKSADKQKLAEELGC